jgi:hypothetical protein
MTAPARCALSTAILLGLFLPGPAAAQPPAAGYPPPGQPPPGPYGPHAPYPPPQGSPDSQTPVYGPYQRSPWVPPDQGPERGDYVRTEPPNKYRHDGFYLRLAGGIGIGRDSAESDARYETGRTPGLVAFEGAGSGFAAATEVAIGFTPVGGLVLGAGIYTATIPSLDAGPQPMGRGSYEWELSQLAIASPHVDFYLDPDRGLHFQGGFGLATYVTGEAKPSGSGAKARAHTGVGLGFMLGIGHQWWVAEQWSLGLIGRVLYAWTEGIDPEGVTWSHSTLAPSLLLAATHH